MKRRSIALGFFLLLGINAKSIAQRYASANSTESATHNSSSAGPNNYDTHPSAPVASAAVKETAIAVPHAASTSDGPTASANNRLPAAPGTAGGSTFHGPSAIIAGAQRYNPVTRHNYPYYSTPVTKQKSQAHNRSFAKERFTAYLPYLYYPDVFPFYECELVYDNMLMDNDNSPKGASVLNTSLDGYVVYGSDTISGIVTVTDKAIYLEQPLDGRHVKGYTFPNTDNNLHAVAVFEGNNALYLDRAGGTGKLSRVIHSGKLSVYDYKYNFVTPENIQRGKMTVAYGGQAKSAGSFLAADSKQLLVEAINSAYGLQLDGKNYTWNQLLSYLDKLD